MKDLLSKGHLIATKFIESDKKHGVLHDPPPPPPPPPLYGLPPTFLQENIEKLRASPTKALPI